MNSDSLKLRAYLKTRGNKGIFQPDFRPPFREVLVNSISFLSDQPFGESVRDFTQTRWFVGDAATMERLMVPFISANLSPDVQQWGNNVMRAAFYTRMVGEDRKPSPKRRALRPPRDFFPKELEEIFGTYFQIGGVSWEAEHPADVRTHWHVDFPRHYVTIPAEPSAHERLEALFFLRDWLRDKLPPTQIAEILSHVQP